jgi:hypothetical protein
MLSRTACHYGGVITTASAVAWAGAAPAPDAGHLGLLPRTANALSRCHDLAADRDRTERTNVAG